MLSGPSGSNDYFSSDHHFAGSFPTPNESSLRTGLTPGGGGSMFPQPSPNSQAIFNAIQSGGATPGTLDFHRTAMHARAASQVNNSFSMPNGATSAPQDPNIDPNIQSKGFVPPGQQQDPFGQGDANDAANGLFMLAQAREGRNGTGQYPAPNQPQQMNYMQNAPNMASHLQQQQHMDSPNMAKRAAKNSIGSNMSGSTNDQAEFSESGDSGNAKPATRAKGKKGSSTKANNNGRRKAEDTPSKGPAAKKQKNNQGSANEQEMDEEDSDDETREMTHDANGKKMTDEEKRKNFLERNRFVTFPVLLFQYKLTTIQSRRPQVPSTQEAMARQPPAKGGDLLYRERRPRCHSHSTPRRNRRSQDPAPRPQGLPSVASPGYQRHGHAEYYWRATPVRQPVRYGDAAWYAAAGHATSGADAEEVEMG